MLTEGWSMTNPSEILFYLGIAVVVVPALLLTVLATTTFIGYVMGEKLPAQLTKATTTIGLISSLFIGGLLIADGQSRVVIELGNLVSIEPEHFHFHLKLIFDRLSIPFTILCFALCAIVGSFASVYLHRDKGYRRFFVYYALFQLGMVVSSLAGTIETLFLGWELVGLSSAMLVAYFHTRPAPVRNGLRIWSVYRLSDAAFLIAALTMHHLTGAGDFELMTGTEPWPSGSTQMAPSSALTIGLLLLFAAAGKSGMVPFSGWLPRAMEGPTPSSAIFYGALSVHLGLFLLLRINPILEASFTLRCVVIAIGFLTALFGGITSRVQTDVKNALAYASLTQVGLITIEIGLGLYYLALFHMIGHACLRTLQLLRAPSTLRDHQLLENAVGKHLSGSLDTNRMIKPFQLRLYRFAMHRGNLDVNLNRFFIDPLLNIMHWCDRMEHRLTNALDGEDSRESTTSSDLDSSSRGKSNG